MRTMYNKKGNIFKGLLLGAGLGILFAPKKGSETRKELLKKVNDLSDQVKDLEYDDVRETLSIKIDELKKELSDLDKEKVETIVRKKAEEIKVKAEELYQLAMEKGTPVLEKAADEVRSKTIKLLNSTSKKLEKSGNSKTAAKSAKK